MVLQREMPVKIFGTGSAGSEVTVSFRDQTKTTAVEKDGSWSVHLDPLKVGPATELKVSGGGSSITRSNVVVGEVWLCAGQSNMGWGTGKCIEDDARLVEILASDDIPNLRILTGKKWTIGPRKGSALQIAFAYELYQLYKVPIGIIGGANSGSKASGWVRREMLMEDAEVLAAYPDEAALEKAFAKPKVGFASNYDPRIAPLAGYTVRAMLWDQGEAGSGIDGMPFPVMTRALFRGWRKARGQEDMPVIYMSKPCGGGPAFDPDSELTRAATPYAAPRPSRKPKKEKAMKKWGAKDANRNHFPQIASLKGTAMIATSDLQTDIHPTMKADYASRAALVARGVVYGEDVVWSGPVVKEQEVVDGALVLTFSEIGSGLTHSQGEALTGFQLVDGKGIWYHAKAEIIEPNKVKVSHASVPSPTFVRYAWGNKIPWANLFNKEGLPAQSFSSDPNAL